MTLPDPVHGHCDVCFLAGEHSGDEHAALLARDLKAAHPQLKMAAIGGVQLEQAGVHLLHDLTAHSVVGLVEVLRNYGYFRELFGAILHWLEKWRPRVLVLVDYPGFNLRLADALQARGISRKGGGKVAVYQYISPQIWAWKAGRRFRMARTIDELGVIFPFESDCYRDTNLPVKFVGHPFSQPGYQPPVHFDPTAGLLLLPGSRLQAVDRIFPVMLETCRALGLPKPATVLYPSERIRDRLGRILENHKMGTASIRLHPVSQGAAAGSVLTSSGTMSLICALAGIPGAIVYRAHPLTYWLGRRLVKIPYLGMANLILNESMYPEFIQREARPDLLAAILTKAKDAAVIDQCLFQSQQLSESLKAPAGSTAVERIAELLANRR